MTQHVFQRHSKLGAEDANGLPLSIFKIFGWIWRRASIHFRNRKDLEHSRIKGYDRGYERRKEELIEAKRKLLQPHASNPIP